MIIRCRLTRILRSIMIKLLLRDVMITLEIEWDIRTATIVQESKIFSRKRKRSSLSLSFFSTSIFSTAFDPQESQYWTQPTSDACCPVDCCHNTSFTTANCGNYQTSTPCPPPPPTSQVPCNSNKSSNVQVRCV